MNKKELNLDTLGEIVDKFLTDNECMMLFAMPEGTQDITVTDNLHGGPVLQFYFLLKALSAVMEDMLESLGGADEFGREVFVDGVLDMVRGELMEVRENGKNDTRSGRDAE